MTAKRVSMLVLAALCCWNLQAVAAQQCSGYLPGNCRVEEGMGFMMCNAGAFCNEFGFPAQHNACESAAKCTDMCAAAGNWGGSCVSDYDATAVLECDGVTTTVQVLRAAIQIPGYGAVYCDDRIQIPTQPAVTSIARSGRRLLRGQA
ncbi:hypothetical protein OEZ85_011971 [Tetradesmus obliquus]|uniref:Chitin-binding type-2 domain-containing protein n=1 Tax=Tetradesmus obliquus TaxID=3088 RepID=A0ABY8TUC3_TETOB|nr:hypothetical protein OEZ85_011971 [Tetradesmus obliquus]